MKFTNHFSLLIFYSHYEFIFTHLVIQASVNQAHILEEGSNKLASK